MNARPAAMSFATLVQDFFCQRLINQREASIQTIGSYRDGLRLLILFAQQKIGKPPYKLRLEDLDVPLILDFLDYCEHERGNSARTRNARLAAIRSFLAYAALRDPTCLHIVERVRSIPMKRFNRPLVDILSREEVEAIINAPDSRTWSGRRDRVMFLTLYNTGARVSEIIGLRREDVFLDRRLCIQIQGKGRKQRAVPLWKTTGARLKDWFGHQEIQPRQPAFPNHFGKPLTRSGVEYRLRLAVQAAASQCTTLDKRHVTPHALRHTTATHLLQSGVDITVIALWLGHEHLNTTQMYVEANLAMKENALAKLQEPSLSGCRYRPSDPLLAFLESL